MENEKPSYKRKTLWVSPYFQLKFILLTLGSTLLIVLMGLLSNWVFVWKFIEYGNSRNLPAGDDYYLFIYKQEATLNLIFLVTSSIIMIFSSIYGLVMSNRIAGPIYRIKKELEKMNAGEGIDRIHVRNGDYFQDLAETINETLENRKSKSRMKAVSKG